MAQKLDLFPFLASLGSKTDAYAALSPDEKKGFAPLVIARWLSGTSDKNHIQLLNEFVNPYVFSLGKHPHLLSLLMQATTKSSKRYSWLGVKSNKKNALTMRAIQEYYEISAREAKLINPLPGQAEVLSMAEALGWDREELKKLQGELKDD